MFKRTIGILGGMGPVASADTYIELARMCQRKYGAVQDSDYPTVILYSLPLENFSHEGFSQNGLERQKIVSQLVHALHVLEAAGSDVIVIDCNTVHYFFDELQQKINVPIINLIEITTKFVVASGYKKVGVFCSQTSRDVGLYTKPLKKEGIEVIPISARQQEDVNQAILAVMSGQVTDACVAKLDAIAEWLLEKGAEAMILGCTEISNLIKYFNHHAIFIDSEALAVARALAFAFR